MKLSSLGAVSAALALCAVAGAQTTDPAPIGGSVRLGVFFPTNSATSDIAGSGFFAFGADYRLTLKAPTFGGFASGTSISVDYFSRDDYGNIPVLLNYLAMKGKYTLSVGAGVGFTSLPGGSDDAKFAYQIGISYDFTTTSAYPIFGEIKFMGSEESKVNGVGAFVGVRF